MAAEQAALVAGLVSLTYQSPEWLPMAMVAVEEAKPLAARDDARVVKFAVAMAVEQLESLYAL